MELTFETAGACGTAVAHVTELTGAKVRIFLSEIAEGVSNYRSMHSLTQQVEHQYHGRFLIELVQNAHDGVVRPNLRNFPRPGSGPKFPRPMSLD